MAEVLTQEQINQLIIQLEKEKQQQSIIEIKPSTITNINNLVEKEKMKVSFLQINDLYVKPLETLLNHSTSKMHNYDTKDLSIIERIKDIQKKLLQNGLSIEQIVSLVPKTVEEVNTLVEARKNGFPDNNLVDNNTRIANATNYINSNSLKPKR